MEETFTFTKDQLSEAFRKYNEAFLNNPEGFSEITATSHIRQSEILIGYLQE